MEIKRFTPDDHKIKCLIYWPSGCGKTTFGATAKDVVFASAENWLLSVADSNISYAEIKNLQDLKSLLVYLSNEKHPYKTLVIDSITEINDMIRQSIQWPSQKPMSRNDWGILADRIEWIIRVLKDLDMNVIILAQEMNVLDEEKIDKKIPSLNWKMPTKICYYMDVVGYMYLNKDGERVIKTSTSNKVLSKDRTNKLSPASLEFEEWLELVRTPVVKAQPEWWEKPPMRTKV